MHHETQCLQRTLFRIFEDPEEKLILNMSNHSRSMKDMDAFIKIREHDNINELEDLTSEKIYSYIVKASANLTEKINQVFDTDEGSRYLGECAIGFNPYITEAINDTLFSSRVNFKK